MHRIMANAKEIVTAFVVVVLVASSVPLPFLESVEPGTRWLADATGLEQDWSMFAPDPRTQVQWLEVRRTHRDGGTEVLRLQDRRMEAGGYRGARWRKYGESVAAERHCRLAERLAERDLLLDPDLTRVTLTDVSGPHLDPATGDRRSERLESHRGAPGAVVHQGAGACPLP